MTFSIHVIDTGESFRCSEQQHLLQGMKTYRVGAPMLKVIPVGCRGGGCGVCRVRVLAGDYATGKMSRKHVSEQQQAQGVALACRVFPRTDLTVALLTPVQTDNTNDKESVR